MSAASDPPDRGRPPPGGNTSDPSCPTEPPEPAPSHQRFTRFMPEPRGRIEPVCGPATDPYVLKALALSGRGWVSRDGRVLAAGSTKGDTALAAMPETAAAVVAFEAADAALAILRERRFEEGLARYLQHGGSKKTFLLHH